MKPKYPFATALLTIALISPALGFVSLQVNHGAPTSDEQAALDKINRFRANPGNELAAMFTESFTGTYNNGQIETLLEGQDWSTSFWRNTFGSNIVSNSMDFFQTRPGTIYSQFQALASPGTSLSWNHNLGWAAHQYAVWVELDAGLTTNPHAIPGAPGFVDRFNNVGVNWGNIGENIARNWPMNVSHQHMGYVIDWGTGPDGIQTPPGHRNSMLNSAFTQLGIGIVDAGWGAGAFTNVQHLANVFSTDPIVYGFVYDSDGQRQAGVLVEVRDGDGNIIGTATTDAIGAYTYIVPGGNTPATAVFSDGVLLSGPIALGSGNGNWFVDVQMIPEPSSSLCALLGMMLCLRRKRR